MFSCILFPQCFNNICGINKAEYFSEMLNNSSWFSNTVEKVGIYVPYLRSSTMSVLRETNEALTRSRAEAGKNEKVHFAKRSGTSIVRLSSNLRDNRGLSRRRSKKVSDLLSSAGSMAPNLSSTMYIVGLQTRLSLPRTFRRPFTW